MDHANPGAPALTASGSAAAAASLDAWIDAHFDAQTRFLQALVQVPTDTPPGDNAPHAAVTTALLAAMGLTAEQHPVPPEALAGYGMLSLTNLVVRQRFDAGADQPHDNAPRQTGPTIALNAHGDVVPPGEGWTYGPYSGTVAEGKLYGRAAAVSKSDFATYTFALRALLALPPPLRDSLRGAVELHFTYDEEFGGEFGPGWLLAHRVTQPDLLIAAGFSHQVVTAHNGCLQLEVTLHGLASHAAYPATGIDALQAANRLLTALYAYNDVLRARRSAVPGITHPYLNVGRIEGGSNTNVVPGKVVLKLDRRFIPEEDATAVEAELRTLILETLSADMPAPSQADARPGSVGLRVDIRRLLLARALAPLPGNAALVSALQRHAEAVFGEAVPVCGSPLYTDVRLYGERGIPAAIYGAGPRTVLESNAKRADEHLVLDDLRGATKVVARTLHDLLTRG